MLRRRALALATVLCSAIPFVVHAQGTALVPRTDAAYRDIDRLSELGVLDSVIIGQRPYSRREIARIAAAVRSKADDPRQTRRLDDDGIRAASEIAARLEGRFGAAMPMQSTEPVFALLDGWSATVTSTDADRRGFPNSQNRLVEATIDPLAERRLGTPPVRGGTSYVDITNRFEPTDWLAFQARERFEYVEENAVSSRQQGVALLLGSVRARFGNIAMVVGRDQVNWAQSDGFGLMLASDAPALDQVSISGDRPFALPGILRRLGAANGMIVYADLGASVSHSHSRLLTYKVSVAPASSFEMGAYFANHFGGTGSRPASFSNRLVDFLPFVDVFRRHDYNNLGASGDVQSDKVLGVDSRLRLDALAGITLAGELQIEDFDIHRLTDLPTGYGAGTFALIVPRITSSNLSARISAKHTGFITYSHNELTNGFTTRGRLLGDELGPDAKSFAAQLRWNPVAAMRVEVEGRSNVYSNAEYRSFYSDVAQTILNVQKISSGPNELRELAIGSLVFQSDDGVSVSLRAGAERIRNWNFAGGRRRDYVAEIALHIGQ